MNAPEVNAETDAVGIDSIYRQYIANPPEINRFSFPITGNPAMARRDRCR